MPPHDLPFPVALLQRRSHNAKSAKDLHDAAYFAWEVSVRLAVALEGTAAGTSLGGWVNALSPNDERLTDPRLRAVARRLGQEGLGRPLGGPETTARGILGALPGYRNRVIGHGSVREPAFYEDAGRALLEGLDAAWAAGVFWPTDVTLCHVESVALEDDGTHRGRVLDLRGLAPLVRDPTGTPLPSSIRPGRLYACRAGDASAEDASPDGAWTDLSPWLLYLEEDGRERVLCFDALHRTHARYLDYATGTALSGRALDERFPDVVTDLRAAIDQPAAADTADASADDAGDGGERFGDFTILGRIGRGAMGVVYLARQRSLGRLVALKMLPDTLAERETSLARFRREVAALSRCEHPNVVKILDYGVEDGTHYYAMEYVEGAPLSDVADALSSTRDLSSAITQATAQVRERAEDRFDGLPELSPQGGATLPERNRWRHLARLFHGAALGLHHLHEAGIVHRDIKPDNIMVTQRDQRAVIMDLGLAQLEDASQSLTREDHGILGTLRYMPPEQLRSDLTAMDRRVDVYALGASLYEMACGRPMLDGDSVPRLVEQVLHQRPPAPEAVAPDMPDDLAAILSKATAKDPTARYAGAREFGEDLDAFGAGRAVAAQPTTLRYLLRVTARRNKPLVLGGAAALLVLIGGTAWFINHLQSVRDKETHLREEAETALGRSEELAASLRIEKAAAEEARKEAEAHLHRAEKLADFVMTDLATDLDELGQLRILGRTARAVELWYDALADDDQPWITRRGRALAYAGVGNVQLARGDLEAALRAYEKSRTLLAVRVAREPTDDDTVRKLADIDTDYAACEMRAGKAKAATRRLRAVIESLEALRDRATNEEDRGRALMRLGTASADLGRVLTNMGRGEEAIAPLNAAVGCFDDLRKSGREDGIGSGSTLFLRADVLQAQGRIAESYRDAMQAVEILRATRKREAALQRESIHTVAQLASAVELVAELERARGNDKAYEAASTEALAMREALLARDPTNAQAKARLADSLVARGKLLKDMERPKDAWQVMRKANRVYKELVEADPANVWRTFDLSVSEFYLGTLARALGSPERALQHLNAHEEILKDLIERGVADDRMLASRVNGLAQRHHVLYRLGKVEEARTVAKETLDAAKASAARDASIVSRQDDLAQAHRRVADHAYFQKLYAEALPDYEAALAIWDRALGRDPEMLDLQHRRVGALGNLSAAYALAGKVKEAHDAVARGRKLLAALRETKRHGVMRRNFEMAAKVVERIVAAAPFRTGERTTETGADHLVVALDHYEREAWAEAAAHFTKAKKGGAGFTAEDRLAAARAAAQASTAKGKSAAALREQALTWIEQDLALLAGDARAARAKALARDFYLRPLLADEATKARFEKLLQD